MKAERLHVIIELTEEKINELEGNGLFSWAINALHDLRIRVPRDDTFDQLTNGHLQFSWMSVRVLTSHSVLRLLILDYDSTHQSDH